MNSAYFDFFDVYIAEIGWLQGSKFKNVVLSEDAVRLALVGLDGAPLFDGSYYSDDKKRKKIGQIRVDGSTVYCSTKYDLTDKHPALELICYATIGRDGGETFVESVKECSLFVSDDDNGNTFRKLDVEA